jgi:hypothetical protein
MSPYREFRWSKGVRGVPYYVIAVHEEVGDECAHEQLIADRFHLEYRDTSLSTSLASWNTDRALLPAYFRVSS